MIQTLLMDFDWTTALVRFSINTIFIASMIFIISRQTVLKRFSFTFMMISLIVFFLCYTLKNFDLNLGMALGLFAIFGIIRYRTLPLQTEEMTYLFVTIGVAVINALSEDFLTVNELIIINITIILFILFGEIILKKLYKLNCRNLLVEGGDELTNYLLRNKIFNTFYLYKSDKKLSKKNEYLNFNSLNLLKQKYKKKIDLKLDLGKNRITLYKI